MSGSNLCILFLISGCPGKTGPDMRPLHLLSIRFPDHFNEFEPRRSNSLFRELRWFVYCNQVKSDVWGDYVNS